MKLLPVIFFYFFLGGSESYYFFFPYPALSFGTHATCTTDFVEVYSGSGDDRQLASRYCGNVRRQEKNN